jgi:hypothetical protein
VLDESNLILVPTVSLVADLASRFNNARLKVSPWSAGLLLTTSQTVIATMSSISDLGFKPWIRSNGTKINTIFIDEVNSIQNLAIDTRFMFLKAGISLHRLMIYIPFEISNAVWSYYPVLLGLKCKRHCPKSLELLLKSFEIYVRRKTCPFRLEELMEKGIWLKKPLQ